MAAPSGAQPPAPGGTPGAAAAFEALLLRQLLQQALPEAGGGGGLAVEALAERLAAAGPFGIARLLAAPEAPPGPERSR